MVGGVEIVDQLGRQERLRRGEFQQGFGTCRIVFHDLQIAGPFARTLGRIAGGFYSRAVQTVQGADGFAEKGADAACLGFVIALAPLRSVGQKKFIGFLDSVNPL